MNILMLVSRLNIGGTEKYILSISQILLTHGIRVGVAAHKGPLADSFKRAGISLHILPTGNKLKQVSFLSLIIAKKSYNLIHAHDSNSFTLAAALSRQHNIPLIITVHGTYHRQNALLAAARTSKRIIVVSPNLSHWLASKKIPKNKIRVIPNGIDTAIFRPSLNKNHWRKSLLLPSSAQIVVYAGRFSPDKYPIAKNVIQAAERIAKKNDKFIAILVGPGPCRSNLIQLAATVNHRLGRRAVIIRPPMSSIQNAYYTADVVIGTGRVALEAMACSKPVISAGVAGYCGIVHQKNINQMIQYHFGDHGAVAPISTEKLSTDINKLLSDPNRAREFGKDGIKTVKRQFSINNVGFRLLQLYKEVMPSH
ncbi:glycosyltransferase [Paenibacillus sp. KQZ6P-2]|uniref:Glycosyltransferase n=1 Tax=Paenibacillus mangrovi TaxID=2931978 RepID=A0A9X1WRK1_9BACL|nr:glycosyltransferase [Paenibacillus mangrovi]MCJ8012343.1 glycosyltransferase [Paenibacillus mangrovi]